MGFLGQMIANKASGADKATKQAAQIGAQAAESGIAEQRRQFDITRADQMPWLSSGQGALNLLNRAAGIATPASRGSFDSDAYLAANQDVAQADWARADPYAHYQQYGQFENRPNAESYFTGGRAATSGVPDQSAFTADPGYQFRLAEGQKAGANQFAARGGAFSGNALKALSEYNQGIASQEYGNWWNRTAGLAGVGQTSANTLANVGQNYAGNVSNLLAQGADARASGLVGSAALNRNALTQGMNNDAQNFGYFFGNRGGNRNNFAWSGSSGWDNVGY